MGHLFSMDCFEFVFLVFTNLSLERWSHCDPAGITVGTSWKKGKSSNQKGGTTDDFDFGLIDFDSQLPDSQLNMIKFDNPCFVRLSNYIGYSDWHQTTFVCDWVYHVNVSAILAK